VGRAGQYPPELRDRAVRMVAEVMPDYGSQWAAIMAVAQKLGIGTAETLRKWVRRAEIDDGRRPGLTSQEHAVGCVNDLGQFLGLLIRQRWLLDGGR
jgi:transposase